MNTEIKIISLDLDGVLFDGSSATFANAQNFGLTDQYNALFQKLSQEEMSLEETINEVAQIWKGIAIDESHDNIIDSLPLMTGSADTVTALKKWNYEVGCISSGVSQFFMAPFARRLNLDFAYSNVIGSTDGFLNGTVKYIMGGPQKVETILEHIKERGYPSNVIASVGNGFNDIDLFRASTFSVAFNPVDKMVSDAASETVESKDLRAILPFFERN
ncbi:MAG: HAD family hydrolase [Candidatus Thorarchaeota archaeon]|jgi:HAD superfamily phosphoserine phosphatase-like hydrolase